MNASITDVVCSEPSGRPHALVQFGGAVAFGGLYAFAWVAGDAAASTWLLLMVTGSALSGVAESLPTHRRRAAGALRVAAIGAFLGLITAFVVAPELVIW